MAKFNVPAGLSGYDGLAIRIIHDAAEDVTSDDADLATDAIIFFGGWWYRHIVECLGYAPDRLPEPLEDDETFSQIINMVLSHDDDTKRKYH